MYTAPKLAGAVYKRLIEATRKTKQGRPVRSGAPQKAGERLGDDLLRNAEKNNRFPVWCRPALPAKDRERLTDDLLEPRKRSGGRALPKSGHDRPAIMKG